MRPRFAFRLLFVAGLVALIASCVPHHRQAPAASAAATPEEDRGPFRLLLVSPQGEIERPEDARIAVVFSRPVARSGPAGSVVRSRDGGAVEGAWIWVGDDTAVFEPKAPLTDSTTYRVTVDTDLRARDGSSLRAANGVSSTFEFSTARPTLVATRYLGWDERERRARVELEYSLPVRPSTAKRSLRFEGQGASGVETAPFDIPGEDRPESVLVAELDAKATRLDGLGVIATGAKGKLPVKGLGPLRVELACEERRRARATEDETVASDGHEQARCDLDQSQLLLRFSKPIRTKDLERHLVLTPLSPALPRGPRTKLDLERDHGTTVEVIDLGSGARVEAGGKYRVTVTAGVRATDEDRLASDQVFSVETADRAPGIEWRDLSEPGVAIAESSRPTLPLALRATNLPTLEMVRSPLDDGQLLDLLFGGAGAAERHDARSIAGRSASWVEALAGSWAERVTFAPAPNVGQSARFEISAERRPPGTSGIFAIATRAPGARTPVPDELRVMSVTDLGVTTKWSPHGGLVWVTRLSSATAVAGASVSIRRVWPKSAARPMRTQEAFVTTTNAAGIALVPAEVSATFVRPAPRETSSSGAPAASLTARPGDAPEAIVLVRHEHDRTFARLPDLAPPDPRAIGSVFTDRLLYRPGETITLKGFFRIPTARGLQTPFGRPVTFEVADADEHVWSSRTLSLDAFGSFSATVAIPKTIKLGSARIRARFGDAPPEPRARSRHRGQPEGWDVHESVSIDEIRVPELKVAASLDRPRYLPGETAQVTIRGSYLLGAPMRNALVRLRVARKRDSFSPRGLDGFFTASRTVEQEDDGARELEARLGADGQVTVPIPIPPHGSQPGRVRRLTVDVTAEDAARAFAVGDSAGKTIHPADLYLGIRGPAEAPPGRPLKAEVAAATIDGERRAGVATRIELRHQGKPGDAEALLGECTVTTTSEAASCEVRPGLPLDRKGGRFWLIATAADTAGRPISAAMTVDVAKSPPEATRPTTAKPAPRPGPSLGFEEACATRPAPNAELEPLELAGREATFPGDVLACLRGTGGPGLLAFEREGILRHEAIARLGPRGASVRLPLTADDPPNVEVALSEVVPRTSPFPRPGLEDRGAPASSFRQLSLAVDAPAKKLAVSIETPAEARPGSEIDATIRVTDDGGRGVPAQVTFWAVDEGILLLRPMRRPDPGAEISTWRSADVITEDTRSSLFVEHTGYHRIKAPSVRQGATSVSPGDYVGRVSFRPLAFWYPNLVTDAAGVVRVRAKLPDNLTTWKTFAVAATTRDEMGGAEGSFRTNKPLTVRPQLPRFLRAGDHVDVAALVDHPADAGGSSRATVTLTASGALTGGGRASADVAGDPPRLPLDARIAGPGTVTFRAESGPGLVDEVTLTSTVKPALSLETRVFAAEVKGGAPSEAVVARFDLARARPDVGGLEWRIATSPLSGLGVQLRDLVEYPYGCTEQLASRLVPLVRLRPLARDLMVSLPADVDDAVRTALASLVSHQRSDGGFGFWRESRASEPALTVLALDALVTAKAHGFAVAPSMVDRATTYLSASSALDPSARAMFEDVLATAGQPRAHELRVLATAHELPLFAKAFLAHAFARVDPAAARRLLDEIATRAETSGALATFADEPAVRATAATRANLSSNARTTALVLRAFVAIEPRHPLVPKLVRGLLALRKDGRWPNTQATAWALAALDDARPFLGESRGAGTVDVGLGSTTIGRVVFAGLPGGEIQSGTIPTARLLASPEKELRVTLGPALGSFGFEGVLQYAPIDLPQVATDRGFHVARTYRRLDRAGGVAAGTPPPQQPFEVGEYVAVDVVVASAKAHELVVLDDPIPSGFEPVNQSFANADRRPIASDPARALVTQRELRDDRVVTFFDELPAGVHLTRYLLRVSHAGRFVVPPAKVECMYAPEIAGQTAASWVSAHAR